MLIQYRTYHIRKERLHLLFRASCIAGRIHCLLKLFQRQVECRICRNQFQKVIVKTFTASIMMFSVAMNGSSDIRRFSMTFG